MRLQTDQRSALTVVISVLAVSLAALLLPTPYIRWGGAILFALAALPALAIVKKRSILSINATQILIILAVAAVLYVFLSFISGLSLGYVSTGRTLTFKLLFGAIVPIVIIIVASELFRRVLLSVSNKLISVAVFIIGISSEAMIAGGFLGFTTAYSLMDFIGISLFPAVTANLLFNYTSRRYGMRPAVAYRLAVTLPAYLIPIESALSHAIAALALLVMPLFLLAFIDALYEKRKRLAREPKSKLRFVFPSVMLVIAALFIMLISCQFRFGLLVIGSSSMETELHKGDAIIYEKHEEEDSVQLGSVAVFIGEQDERVVHRIIDAYPIDGKTVYITKGDANEIPDRGYITEEDVIGTVRFKIPYVGYPTLWLHDIFAK